MLPERAASATPGKVHVDENVRNVIERRAMSLRYPPKRSGPPPYQNGTLPTPRFHTSNIHLNGPIEQNERIIQIPPPALLQNGTFEVHPTSSRRSEMSAIASQEEDRFAGRARPSAGEFYQNPQNKFKSLPIPAKQKKSESNIAVRAFRWFKNALRGGKKKSRTPTESPQMESNLPPFAPVRTKSLPRNTRFRNRSTRREPIIQSQPSQPPTPALVPSGTLQRIVQPSRTAEFISPVSQEPVHSTLHRAGSFHQTGDRKSLACADGEESGMYPLSLGFPNLGNTCYWNAVLQALGACEPIAAYYIANHRDASRTRRNSMNHLEELSYYFGKLIYSMWNNSTDGGEHIRRLRAIFHRENNNFGKTYQEDAHEFLVCLLNLLTADVDGNECFAINIHNPELTKNIFGLDRGAFKNNMQSWVENIMWCPICEHKAGAIASFTPFITLAFPGRYENICNFIALKNPTNQHRAMKHTVHVNASEGMVAARYLIAHETGISDNQLLIFQMNTSTFCQTVITEHDLIRNRQYRGADELYVTQLEPVALKLNAIEIVTVIFVHTELNHENGSMTRLTHPFKCVLPLDASYQEIVSAIRDASGPVFQHPNQSLLFANDILVIDDNEDHCFLNRVATTPLLNDRVDRCLAEQTRIYPLLPRYLRMVVRWKNAKGIIFPQYDAITHSTNYMEINPGQPYTLSYLFARYFAPEWLPDYCCERCKRSGNMRSSKYFIVPNIIAVSFKRFRHSINGIPSRKIDSSVTFPLENFDVSTWAHEKYSRDNSNNLHFDVISLACHAGTLENGHYYTYSRNPTTDIWRRYDDNHVQLVQTVDEGSSAYVMFMQNHNDRLLRKKNMTQIVRENNSLFNSLRFRKSRDSLYRIPNGPVLAMEENIPPRRESLTQIPNVVNDGFNRNDISRSSRQTHL